MLLLPWQHFADRKCPFCNRELKVIAHIVCYSLHSMPTSLLCSRPHLCKEDTAFLLAGLVGSFLHDLTAALSCTLHFIPFLFWINVMVQCTGSATVPVLFSLQSWIIKLPMRLSFMFMLPLIQKYKVFSLPSFILYLSQNPQGEIYKVL